MRALESQLEGLREELGKVSGSERQVKEALVKEKEEGRIGRSSIEKMTAEMANKEKEMAEIKGYCRSLEAEMEIQRVARLELVGEHSRGKGDGQRREKDRKEKVMGGLALICQAEELGLKEFIDFQKGQWVGDVEQEITREVENGGGKGQADEEGMETEETLGGVVEKQGLGEQEQGAGAGKVGTDKVIEKLTKERDQAREDVVRVNQQFKYVSESLSKEVQGKLNEMGRTGKWHMGEWRGSEGTDRKGDKLNAEGGAIAKGTVGGGSEDTTKTNWERKKAEFVTGQEVEPGTAVVGKYSNYLKKKAEKRVHLEDQEQARKRGGGGFVGINRGQQGNGRGNYQGYQGQNQGGWAPGANLGYGQGQSMGYGQGQGIGYGQGQGIGFGQGQGIGYGQGQGRGYGQRQGQGLGLSPGSYTGYEQGQGNFFGGNFFNGYGIGRGQEGAEFGAGLGQGGPGFGSNWGNYNGQGRGNWVQKGGQDWGRTGSTGGYRGNRGLNREREYRIWDKSQRSEDKEAEKLKEVEGKIDKLMEIIVKKQ